MFYNTGMETTAQTEIEKEMAHLVGEAQKKGITLRLVGGLAIKIRCPRSLIINPERVYNDMDMITDNAGGKKLENFFTEMSFS